MPSRCASSAGKARAMWPRMRAATATPCCPRPSRRFAPARRCACCCDSMAAMGEKLSHFDEAGQAHMVDVSAKPASRREAVAGAFVELNEAVLAALPANPKGNPLEIARFAGIQAAKKTAELIPMCHPLALTHVDVRAEVANGGVRITATAATIGPTGVEMEALTAGA